jgi:hypothetical protein
MKHEGVRYMTDSKHSISVHIFQILVELANAARDLALR